MISDKWNLKNISKIIYDNGDYININLFYIIDEFKKIKNDKQTFLTLCDYSYPEAMGGGEMWLYDIANKMHDFNYNSIIITFKNKNHEYFDKLNIINNKKITIIQMVNDDIDIIKLIKYLNPCVVSHQGLNRIKYMKLCNILNIPFISGFCFWNDILNINENYFNINILNSKKITKSDNFDIIYKNTDYLYCASLFVNKVIQQYHNVDIPTIDTISTMKIIDNMKPEYITMININYYKGGWLIMDLLDNVDIDVPFLFINSEKNNIEFDEELIKKIEIRNSKFKNKTILINNKTNKIEEIYKKTKILLIGSLVDETFCRVAYEGMINKIPILSTINGNLQYLLKNYADFLKEESKVWIDKIKNIYNDETYLSDMSNRKINNNLEKDFIFNKFHEIVKNIKPKQMKQNNNKIGLFVPWCDQGLGIQGREYYIELIKKNFKVYVFSFKPYVTSNNLLNQQNLSEWNFPNVYYYEKYRENITLIDIIDFIHKTQIKTIVIPEICFEHIFYIVIIFKLLNVKCIGIPNIEIVKFNEIHKYNVFDVIMCNNKSSMNLLKYIKVNTVVDYLGFYMNHPYLKYKKINKNKYIQFYCCGGYNSFIRKHIDKICDVFNNIDNIKVKLFVYIQDKQLKNKISKYKKHITFIFENKSYYENLQIHRKHDIFIHMGSHEGLGLGFYEAIQSGTPVITIDTTPNNEIIHNNVNGWLINSKKFKLIDNKQSIIYGDIFDENDLKKKVLEIIDNFDEKKMFNNIQKFNDKLKKKNYIENLIKYL